MSTVPSSSPSRSGRKCPICGKPRVAEHTPFCSTRCRDRDLVRWFGEGYAIPAAGPGPDAHGPGPGPADGDEPDED